MSTYRPLILMPSYNTGPILVDTVRSALESSLPLWVIIDGSTDGSAELLECHAGHPQLRVLRLEKNHGKGAAILHALEIAYEEGFSHVLTMDADGQHPADSIPRFIELSEKYPHAAVFGVPVFDSSAPAIRVNGRKVSNFWANLETLGWGIDDSLFGMRLYPAEELLKVFRATFFARRFDFEPECGVRIAWRGVPIINVRTPVRYLSKDEGGVSQFRYLRDNILLTWMHARLIAGFLLRMPYLAWRGDNPLQRLNTPPRASES